jgi:hypothetical protein
MRPLRWTVALTAAAATALAVAPAASADQDHGSPWRTRTLNSDVIAPFHLTTSQGSLYVADGATSTVSKINRNGSLTTVATGAQPGEVTGVAFSDNGASMAYTGTDYVSGKATLTIRTGKRTVVADLSAFEAKRNPDKRNHYGLADPTCAGGALGPIASYTGMVDSHPYAVTRWNGSWVVADAAGNTLLRVRDNGAISTLAVLPPQPLLVTPEFAQANGVPDCAGQVYAFEPVPTDVEVGRDGRLLVSTLPGGPEDQSAGARGSVYRVNPWSGASTRVATGFAGATSLTETANGTIYVAELFAGRVSMVKGGGPVGVVDLPGVVAVEAGNGHLYAGTLAPFDDQGNPTGTGSVVRLR